MSVRGRLLAGLSLLALVAVGGACRSLGYMTQAVAGGAKILVQRRPIERVLERDDLDAEKRRKLSSVSAIREFAVRELALPDDGSYRCYAAVGRSTVTWNVVATPELAVEPLTWCFPIAGCVSYRGYFRQTSAERFAAGLATDGYDVTVREAIAYSTLGWFDDPVLDTFLVLDDWQLAGLLFHELAHRTVYAADDTAFNESYAETVEELGLERWLALRGDSQQIAAARAARTEERRFDQLRLAAREQLDLLYRSSADTGAKREGKRRILAELVAEQRRLRESGELGPRWDAWLEREPNNADLAAVAAYAQWLPALRNLFERSGEFSAFHDAVRELAALDGSARRRRLEQLDTDHAESPQSANP